MRTVADQLGIMAYLWIMYGGPPDRAMVSAVLRTDSGTPELPQSLSVAPPQSPVDEAVDVGGQSEQVAA